MSTKTNVYMNWTGVTVSFGVGPTVIALTEITDVQVLDEDGLEMWQSDGNKFATVVVAATGARGMTLTGGDLFKLATMPRNTPCTIVAVLRDAINGTGSGAITHTLVNAVMAGAPRGGATNKFAMGSVTFMAFSPDGSTDPLTLTQAS
jgi:cyanophycinase-like exopeptidase